MNVYLRKSVAGATLHPPWKSFVERNPKMTAELEVKWESPPLVNNGLVAREDVAQEVVDKIKNLILNLHTLEEGRQLLSALPLVYFESATEATYQPVRYFMK